MKRDAKKQKKYFVKLKINNFLFIKKIKIDNNQKIMKLFGWINSEKEYDTYCNFYRVELLGKFDIFLEARMYLNYKDETNENDEPHDEFDCDFTIQTKLNGAIGYSVEDFLGAIRACYFHCIKEEEREMTEEEYYKIEEFLKNWKNEFDENLKIRKESNDYIFVKSIYVPGFSSFRKTKRFEIIPNHFEFIEEDIDEYFKILKKK